MKKRKEIISIHPGPTFGLHWRVNEIGPVDVRETRFVEKRKTTSQFAAQSVVSSERKRLPVNRQKYDGPASPRESIAEITRVGFSTSIIRGLSSNYWRAIAGRGREGGSDLPSVISAAQYKQLRDLIKTD